jgi:hypothetical protein
MEDTLKKLQAANPGLTMLSIADPELARFGRLLSYDASEMVARTKAILPETERVVYQASVPALEEPSALNTAIFQEVYGGMPMQVGWCYGHNLGMRGLEYHKGSEVNVCVTDTVFLLGSVLDVKFGEDILFDTADVVAFYAPEGSVVEFAPWNLHLAPNHVREGGAFCTLVYLPRGTNEPLPFAVEKSGESRLLTAVNKWLIAHPDSQGMVDRGVYPGMVGSDIVLNPVS